MGLIRKQRNESVLEFVLWFGQFGIVVITRGNYNPARAVHVEAVISKQWLNFSTRR
jgi:hypothetical protein